MSELYIDANTGIVCEKDGPIHRDLTWIRPGIGLIDSKIASAEHLSVLNVGKSGHNHYNVRSWEFTMQLIRPRFKIEFDGRRDGNMLVSMSMGPGTELIYFYPSRRPEMNRSGLQARHNWKYRHIFLSQDVRFLGNREIEEYEKILQEVLSMGYQFPTVNIVGDDTICVRFSRTQRGFGTGRARIFDTPTLDVSVPASFIGVGHE